MTAKIKLEAVSKQFGSGDKAFVALDDLSFEIEAGEFLAIVGPSGCGKTTVLNMLAGLDAPSGGQMLLDDRPISGPGAERGVMFQDYALFPWRTVRGNIEFGLLFGKPGQGVSAAERRRRVEAAIELVGLAGAEHKYPHQLSGGMHQRVALGRLVANAPDILLMDEPLAALDAQTRIILQDELLRIWGQDRPPHARKTVVFITHAIDEAVFLADRVLVLSSHPGRLKATVDIPLARPRNDATRKSATFAELGQSIWELIRDEAYRATMN